MVQDETEMCEGGPVLLDICQLGEGAIYTYNQSINQSDNQSINQLLINQSIRQSNMNYACSQTIHLQT